MQYYQGARELNGSTRNESGKIVLGNNQGHVFQSTGESYGVIEMVSEKLTNWNI